MQFNTPKYTQYTSKSPKFFWLKIPWKRFRSFADCNTWWGIHAIKMKNILRQRPKVIVYESISTGKLKFCSDKRFTAFYFVMSAEKGINKEKQKREKTANMPDAELFNCFTIITIIVFVLFVLILVFRVEFRQRGSTERAEVLSARVNCIRKCIQFEIYNQWKWRACVAI